MMNPEQHSNAIEAQWREDEKSGDVITCIYLAPKTVA